MNERLKKQYLDLIDETLHFLRGKKQGLPPTPIQKVAAKEMPKPKLKPVEKIEKKTEPQKEAPPLKEPESEAPKPAPKPKLKPIVLNEQKTKVAPKNMSSFLSFMTRAFPHTRVHAAPLADHRAKAVRFTYKDKQNLSSVPLLYDASLLPYKPLLENIAKAISLTFSSSRLLDVSSMHASDNWDTLLSAENITLILAPDSILARYPKLTSFIDEAGAHSLLGPHSLLHLPDLSLYQKDPLLKRSLWETLCQKLHTN